MSMKVNKMESEGYATPRPVRQSGSHWPWIILAFFIVLCGLAIVGGYDLVTGRKSAQVAQVSMTKASETPSAAAVAKPTSEGWTVPLLPNVSIPTMSLPKIGSSVAAKVEKVECTVVDDRLGGCGSMKLGPAPEYPISMKAIDALPLLYIERFCHSMSCVNIRHNAHGLDSKVPPGFEWEQKLFDDCAAKGMKLIEEGGDDGEGFYCG